MGLVYISLLEIILTLHGSCQSRCAVDHTPMNGGGACKAPDKVQVTRAEYEICQILFSKIVKPVLMYK